MTTPQLTAADASRAPDGSVYPLPSATELQAHASELAAAAERHRAASRTVVAVQGLGFVGSAVVAAVAAATAADGSPAHFAIGVDLPRPETYWKVATVAAGGTPVVAPDPALAEAIAAGVARGNLTASASESAYGLADVIVVDVDLGVRDLAAGADAAVDLAPYEAAIRAVGQTMREDALVVVETTSPVGTSRKVALAALSEERRRRGIETPPLLAHAPERVMPGPRYLESVRAFPRVFAGADAESARRAQAFLSTIVDAELRELPTLEAAELTKLLENSYRSANIAFLHEWTLLAESIGVDLWSVVDAIRVRKGTHDNIRSPGLGVGGYCLPKDALLAQWGAAHLLGSDVALSTTLDALETNRLMPLHTFEHARRLAIDLRGRTVALCGVAYIPDVADTRNAPSELLHDALVEAGADVRVHDPHVVHWIERPEIAVSQDLAATLDGADGVVLAVPHAAYRALGPGALERLTGRPAFLVDAQDVVGDEAARALHAAGWLVSGVGKGHWLAEGLGERE